MEKLIKMEKRELETFTVCCVVFQGGSLGLTVVQYGSTHYVRFSYNLGANLITITNYAVAVRSGDWFRVYATR